MCWRCWRELDAKLRAAVDSFDFNTYVRALTDFCNEDLSAPSSSISARTASIATRPTSPSGMAYRTVLDTLFHALVRYAAPVLVFTSEEVWGTRYPDAGRCICWNGLPFPHFVIPAKAGIDHLPRPHNLTVRGWTPAFAGVTSWWRNGASCVAHASRSTNRSSLVAVKS